MEKIIPLQLPASGNVQGIYFSLGTTPSKDPQLNCAQAVCELFRNAKESVQVCIYSLTESSIIDSIIEAHNRGVDISIIVDFTQSKGKTMSKAVKKLQDSGINVKVAIKQKACMHNKVAVFDGEIVCTGSYNWTQNASKRNDENLIVIKGRKLAGLYQKYVFDRIEELETLRKKD